MLIYPPYPAVIEEARRRYEAGEGRERWTWNHSNRLNGHERRVQAAMRGIGFALAQGQPHVDPFDALLQEVTRCQHRILWYEAQILRTAQTPEDLLPNGPAFPWVAMQGGERKRLVDATKIALAAGIEAHRLRAIEVQAEALMTATRAGLAALDITGQDQERFLEAMTSELLRLTSQQDSTPRALEAS